MRLLLRIIAVLSSLALLVGCVWFAQRQARPTAMPGSKSGILSVPATVTPAASQPASASGPMIMSGSKSFSGPMIKGDQLQAPFGKQGAKL